MKHDATLHATDPWRPRIVVLLGHNEAPSGPSPLARCAQAVADSYAAAAQIRVVDRTLADFLPYARRLEDEGRVDAFIGSSTAGQFLAAQLSTPVALIRENGLDLLDALRSAAQITRHVAVFSRAAPHPVLASDTGLFSLAVRAYTYHSNREGLQLLRRARDAGVGAVIGSPIVTQGARQLGMAGILSLAQHAVRQSVEEALVFCRQRHEESGRQQALHTMLAHLDEGMALLDAEGRVQALNPALARLLAVTPGQVLGQPLAELAPALANTPAPEDEDREHLVALGERRLLVQHTVVRTDGAVSGAVLRCQDAEHLERVSRRLHTARSRNHFPARHHLYQILGSDPALRQTLRLAGQYARHDATVLITGESGTGKELLAQGIHNASHRRQQPFVAINCAALPETLLESELFGYEEGAFSGSRRGGKPGVFELAHTGTLLLDEIGDMPLALQTRLLRVLQEREVMRLGATQMIPLDVRIIAATHQDLATQVQRGQFRADLYYRLNILRLHLPALRQRPADLSELSLHLLRRVSRRLGVAVPEAALLRLLQPWLARHDWPGNVRELENALERAAIAAGIPSPGGLSEDMLRAALPELFAGSDPAALDTEASNTGNLLATAACAPSLLPVPPTAAGTAAITPALPPSAAAVPAASALPDNSQPARPVRTQALQAQAQHALAQCGGNRQAAAQQLGISRATLWRWLRG